MDEILPVEEVADRIDRDVGRRVRRKQVRVVRELPLLREHGRDALSPVQLRGGEDPHLVVDEHVPLGRKAALDVVELLLLVNVDEHGVDDVADAGLDCLSGLEDGVAVGEDDRGPEIAQSDQHLERARIEAIRERILEQVLGEGEQPGIPALRLPPLLHRAEIVAVPELDEAPLLNRPVRGARIRPVLPLEVPLEIVPEAIVVEEGVVDVDEEGRGPRAHRDILSHVRHDPSRSGPEGGSRVRAPVQALVTAMVAAVLLLTGCGGSDSETVNGCVIEPETQCANIDLSGADLEGADLSRAVLSGANLESTNLSGANLSEADLSDAQIVDTNLSDADLTSANLSGATITGTDLSGATLCGTTQTDGTIDDTSCPSSTDTTDTETTDTETTDTTENAEAEVTSFELSELDCGSATTGPVTVTWETQNATAVEIAVDTASPTSGGPSGSTTVVVACDGEPHAITITPESDAGPGVPDTKEVSSD